MMAGMVSFDEKAQFIGARAAMVETQLKSRGIKGRRVLEVMGQLPREEFISPQYAPEAYADRPVPIGLGQTISQPYIVALMTERLRLNDECDVLELGTGCGYQTAILARLAGRVFTVERLGQLSEGAQAVLGRLGVDNVEFYTGDGSEGWYEDRQFDRIIVTAAIPEAPRTLKDQLKDGGLLVAPVGGALTQELMLYEKQGDVLESEMICSCRFVKLIGKHGFDE
jgi:protein-L-isoaspartate(D-aspartate) O-methyltransferase